MQNSFCCCLCFLKWAVIFPIFLSFSLALTKTLKYCTFLSAFTPHYIVLSSTQNWCLGAALTHCFQWNLLHILQQAASGHKSSSGILDVRVYSDTMVLLVCICCCSQTPIQRSGSSKAVCSAINTRKVFPVITFRNECHSLRLEKWLYSY